jgi:hypothetical protein
MSIGTATSDSKPSSQPTRSFIATQPYTALRWTGPLVVDGRSHAERQPASSVPTRVLVVLDQPALAELVKLTLTHGTFEVRQTFHPNEALDVLARWRPPVVLLDMDREGLDGAQVIDRVGPLHRDRAGPRLPLHPAVAGRPANVLTRLGSHARSR